MSSSRRKFLKLAAAAGAIKGASLGAQSSNDQSSFSRISTFSNAKPLRPNILYINSHDTGRYTSPYGYQAPTPNLQRLADDGVCFAQAHCVAPTCSASRASLLTGQYSHNNGMLGLVNRGFRLADYRQHILHTLRKEAGYTSALVGLQHIAPHSSMIGYDYVQDVPGNHVEQVVPPALQFIRRSPKQPFWLEVGFYETHRPYSKATPEDKAEYIRPPENIPNVPETRQDMADFHASVRKVDWAVGKILACLEAEGIAGNTLVISATDHGISFPDMKANLYDGGTGVHLVMRGPGGFAGGKICNAMVSHVDIFPTICDLLDVSYPAWLQGKSLLPVVREQAREVNDALFAELNYHASYEPKRSVRTAKWKYIRHYSPYIHPTLPNCDDGLSKSYWVGNGWGKQVIPREQLFDLTFDPNERNNLAADPSSQEMLAEMRRRLDAWMTATADPLLNGPVPAPSGAQLNPPDEVSPDDPVQVVS